MIDRGEYKEKSILAYNMFLPLILLCEELNEHSFKKTSTIRRSPIENGFSTAIIILINVIIESFVNNEDCSNTNFFKKIKKINNITPETIDKIKELRVVRDAIVHNKIWTISYEYDCSYQEKNIKKQKNTEFNDRKYKKAVKEDNDETDLLKLNVIPTKIGIDDVKKSISVLNEFLKCVNNEVPVFYKEEEMSFSDFSNIFCK